MGKEISFYKVDKRMTEEDMRNRFGQHLIRIKLDGNVYVMEIKEHLGTKLDFNEHAEELMKLSEYMTGKMKELVK